MTHAIKPTSPGSEKTEETNQWVHDLRNAVWGILTSAEVANNALANGQGADVQTAMKSIERNSEKCMDLLQKTPFD